MRHLDTLRNPHDLIGQPWLSRLLLTVLALTSFGLLVAGSASHLPFDLQCDGVSCDVAAGPASPGAAPLRPGDRVSLAEQPFATRAVLIDDNVPRGPAYAVVAHRGSETIRTTFHTVAVVRKDDFAQSSVFAFVLLFGLLMLWRGESGASLGLCVFALSIIVTAGLYTWPFAPPWNLIARGIGTLTGGPGAFMGLYITADALVRSDLGGRAARRARAAYLGALLLLFAAEVVPIALVLRGREVPYTTALQIATLLLAVVIWLVPLIYLLRGYRTSTPASRLRIRWFIASMGLLLPLIACNLLTERAPSGTEFDVLRVAQILLTLTVFSMLSYAALSQRLVAVRFVLNRALVFGFLTASLVGALSLLESLIERSVISREAGVALDIAVPLLLGISIQRIHRWGEDSVERVVFRHEYRARNEITSFVRDAGFISQPLALYERAVAVFAAHSGGHYAALYLAEKAGYERVAASEHARGLPERLGVDEVAMVRLRATLAPLDLFTLASALGATGLVLPLVIRGRLEGALVCGAKAEGRYAQAEVEFLGKAAAGIAACVVALRAEIHGRFVSQVAEGSLSAERILEEARLLAES